MRVSHEVKKTHYRRGGFFVVSTLMFRIAPFATSHTLNLSIDPSTLRDLKNKTRIIQIRAGQSAGARLRLDLGPGRGDGSAPGVAPMEPVGKPALTTLARLCGLSSTTSLLG